MGVCVAKMNEISEKGDAVLVSDYNDTTLKRLNRFLRPLNGCTYTFSLHDWLTKSQHSIILLPQEKSNYFSPILLMVKEIISHYLKVMSILLRKP